MSDKRIVNLGDEEVIIEPSDLMFTDTTLNVFFERVGGRIDYIGRCLADAQRLVLKAEQDYDYAYLLKFKEIKETEGRKPASDKVADAFAKADKAVQEAKTNYIEAKHKKDLLYNHLSALNAAREDAYNRGHFLRKEFDKMYDDNIYRRKNNDDYENEILKDSSNY